VTTAPDPCGAAAALTSLAVPAPDAAARVSAPRPLGEQLVVRDQLTVSAELPEHPFALALIEIMESRANAEREIQRYARRMSKRA
jgi:hypothetical protein